MKYIVAIFGMIFVTIGLLKLFSGKHPDDDSGFLGWFVDHYLSSIWLLVQGVILIILFFLMV
jgi:hypothetical protein